MNVSVRSVLIASCAAALLAVVPAAKANTVTGSVYNNTGGADANLTPGSAGTLVGTFTAPSPLNFSSFGGTTNPSQDYTIVSFLNTGGGVYTGTDGTLNNTLFYINGTVSVTNGEMFTATHDDGLVLDIDGISVINDPGPTSPTTTTETYTGPTGTFAFELGYAEVEGAPAVLQIDLPLSNPVPEPSSFMLLGSGLLGAAGVLRRRMKA